MVEVFMIQLLNILSVISGEPKDDANTDSQYHVLALKKANNCHPISAVGL
jgi:hypothetical protein